MRTDGSAIHPYRSFIVLPRKRIMNKKQAGCFFGFRTHRETSFHKFQTSEQGVPIYVFHLCFFTVLDLITCFKDVTFPASDATNDIRIINHKSVEINSIASSCVNAALFPDL